MIDFYKNTPEILWYKAEPLDINLSGIDSWAKSELKCLMCRVMAISSCWYYIIFSSSFFVNLLLCKALYERTSFVFVNLKDLALWSRSIRPACLLFFVLTPGAVTAAPQFLLPRPRLWSWALSTARAIICGLTKMLSNKVLSRGREHAIACFMYYMFLSQKAIL